MDANEIRKWHKVFKQDNELFEIRILGDRTWSGYFYDVETAIKALEPFDNANIYYSINEVKKACASREQFNCFKQVKGTATSKQDIEHRWWLPIDVDCERPSGVSSTNEEKGKGKGESVSQVYMPSGNFSITWDDQLKAYLYIGFYSDGQAIADGYTDATRPDGARIVLNNGRGELVWSSITRTWIKQ